MPVVATRMGALGRLGRARVVPAHVLVTLLVASTLAATCGRASSGGAPAAGERTTESAKSAPSGPAAAVPSRPPAAPRPRIVVLGDSLTAGYGLPTQDQSFPAVLQQKVDEARLPYEVVNMGVSGDTTAGGLRRLDWALDGDVKVLVVALGGNDGLRGLGPAQMRENLSAIVDGATRRGARVLLCGMEAPPNLGGDYTRQFRAVYGELARDRKLAFLPFLLDGVAGLPEFNQPDGIHPNAAGAQRVGALVWTKLRPMLTATATS